MAGWIYWLATPHPLEREGRHVALIERQRNGAQSVTHYLHTTFIWQHKSKEQQTGFDNICRALGNCLSHYYAPHSQVSSEHVKQYNLT